MVITCHDRAVGLIDLLWRGIAVFRIAALAYAAALIGGGVGEYAHPVPGWLVFGVMAAWTAFAGWAYAVPGRRRWPLLAADLAAASAALAASYWVVGPAEMAAGAGTLPMAWVAAPVMAWAIRGGRWLGAFAALAVGAVDLAVRGISFEPVTINATVLLLLAGVLAGYVARLAGDVELQLRRAAQREAALRAQVAGDGEPGAGGPTDAVDLRAVLRRYASADVTISAPVEPVSLPGAVAAELAAAVGSALDNVRAHCRPHTPARVLVEAEPVAVTVTVRDDGPGIPEGRLAQAAAEGRLGVAQSIQGRMRHLGGTAVLSSAAGQGTEVELRLPRPAAPP
jgi:hypothetical protein